MMVYLKMASRFRVPSSAYGFGAYSRSVDPHLPLLGQGVSSTARENPFSRPTPATSGPQNSAISRETLRRSATS
jgi:hypothetical protein